MARIAARVVRSAAGLLLAAAACGRPPPPPGAPAPDTVADLRTSPRDRTLARILEALEARRFDAARALVARARARWPDDPVFATLASGLDATAPQPPPDDRAAPAPAPKRARVVRVAAPPWERTFRAPVPGAPLVGRPKIARIEARRNRITDVRRWFVAHGIPWPKTRAEAVPATADGDLRPPPGPPPPSFVPRERFGLPLAWVLRDGPYVLALYERPGHLPPPVAPADERPRYPQILAIHRPDGSLRAALDFSAFRLSPRTTPGDATLAQQDLIWAHFDGTAVYVAHGHWTYAAASGGQTGYVTAVDPDSGTLFWRSRPRVANARNFVRFDGYLVTGYGFTREPDSLYLLRLQDGEVMASRKVHTAPEYLAVRPGDRAAPAGARPGDPARRATARLFVRSYDHDYVFALTAGPRTDEIPIP